MWGTLLGGGIRRGALRPLRMGTLLGGGIRRGALRPLRIPMRICSISTPNRDANGAYIFLVGIVVTRHEFLK